MDYKIIVETTTDNKYKFKREMMDREEGLLSMLNSLAAIDETDKMMGTIKGVDIQIKW